MKYPLEWHRKNITNTMKWIEAETITLNNKLKDLQKQTEIIEFYQKQVDTAEKERKTGFDAEKYLISRK
jgi:hypothetical protein